MPTLFHTHKIAPKPTSTASIAWRRECARTPRARRFAARTQEDGGISRRLLTNELKHRASARPNRCYMVACLQKLLVESCCLAFSRRVLPPAALREPLAAPLAFTASLPPTGSW